MKFTSLVITTAFALTLASCSSSSNDNSIDNQQEGEMPAAESPAEETPGEEMPAPDSSGGETPASEPPVTETPTPPATPATTEAKYRITFDANWTEARHPVQFPSANPHFSGLVGAVHNAQVIFWERGQIASDGIELMAETGGKSIFLREIEDAISNGSTLAAIDGPGIGTGDGQASVEVTVNTEYPEITITSMLAPSPDWFVGLHNFALYDGSNFIGNTSVDAVLYDSGTDSGLSYTSGNSDTQPRDPIATTTSQPTDSSFLNGLPNVGRFIIERL